MQLTDKEKEEGIAGIEIRLIDVQNYIDTLKKDIHSDDNDIQMSACFIGVELVKMMSKFVEQIQLLAETKRKVTLPKSPIFIPKAAKYKLN